MTKPSSAASKLLKAIERDRVVILPPTDVRATLALVSDAGLVAQTTILDPWYNKGVGGVDPNYDEFIREVLQLSAKVSQHVYLWGFPEIVASFVNVEPGLQLNAWLTWFYKNSPSVIRGWRSSQQSCLHLTSPGAKLYPENFMSEEQHERFKNGLMRFIPGPPSVIEESLLVGFVGKKEKTPHPAQKPIGVYNKLILMGTTSDDLVLDPMAGSGTAGVVAKAHNRRVILADHSEDYTKIMESRLGVKRLKL